MQSMECAVAGCLSVCASVCLSVTCQYSVETAKHIKLFLAIWVATSFWFLHSKRYGNILIVLLASVAYTVV